MNLIKKLTGYEVEKIPNVPFRIMKFALSIRDLISPVKKQLDKIVIEKKSVVMDFGCGPGSYLNELSKRVGDGGVIYAVDVQPLAIESVNNKIRRFNLNNIIPVLSSGYPLPVAEMSCDTICAFDMFHHIKDQDGFFKELHRVIKPQGMLYLDAGHQPMDAAKEKVHKSGLWQVESIEGRVFVCKPHSKEINA